jgi:transcriptional antiterminator RfaH
MTTAPDAATWYVVHTHPRAEATAADNLARQGFTAFFPRYLKRRRHARKVENVPAPLFPRYVFVAVDVTRQRWRAILSTVGVTHLISRGDEPTPVARGVVEELRRRLDPDGFVPLAPAAARLKQGDAVRVREGAFARCLGLFEGISDSERVAILLDLLGRKVRVVVDVDAIEAA